MTPSRLALIAGGVTLLAFGWFLTCGSTDAAPPGEQTPGAVEHAGDDEAPARGARQTELAGRVVNDDGDAVPGARVWLLPAPVPLTRCQPWLDGCACADDAATLAQLEDALRPRAETTSDASGRFVFRDVVVEAGAAVVAAAAGLAGATRDVRGGSVVVTLAEADVPLADALEAPAADVVVLSFAGPRVAAVTRFDAAGRAPAPFDGPALAVARGRGGRWLRAPLEARFAPVLGRVTGERPPSLEVDVFAESAGDEACISGRADAEGGFSLGDLRGGERQYRVVVSGGGLRGVATARPGVPVEVTLGAPAVIAGVVRDEGSDAPLAAARVEVVLRGSDGRAGPRETLTLTTDAAGRFEAEVVAGEVEVRASKAGYESPTPERADGVHRLAPGERAEVVVLLTPLGLVSGVVEDEAGAPVSGAHVSCGSEGFSDEAGRFSVGCTRALSRLRVSADGYADAVVEVQAPRDGLVIRLRAGAVVRGLVVDAAGRGVVGARVVVDEAKRVSATSGDSGAFTLSEALDDGRWTLTASTVGVSERRKMAMLRGLAGLTGSTEVEVHAKRAPEVVVITVRGAGDVSGRVVDSDGKPVAGVLVGVQVMGDIPDALGARGRGMLQTLRDVHNVSQAETRTSEDGAFVIEGLAAGEHRLFALSGDVVSDPRQRVMVRGGDRDVILRVLRRPRVRGRVLSADGAPIAHFSVEQTGVDSPDGRFDQPLPGPDSERVTVSAPGHVNERRNVRASWGDTVDLGDVSLAPGRSVTVSAVDARTGARVAPFFAVDGRPLSFQEESGRLEGLPLETVSVQVSHFDYQSTTLLVPAGLDPAAVLPVKLRRR